MSRMHIGLGTADIDAAVAFYTQLLGAQPSKRRPGYARFEPESIGLNLSLNQASGDFSARGPEHFGLQVQSSQTVNAAGERMKAAGYPVLVEEQVTCCYAVQDKVWIHDPDGRRWEVFVTTDDDAPHHEPTPAPAVEEPPCCAPTCCT